MIAVAAFVAAAVVVAAARVARARWSAPRLPRATADPPFVTVLLPVRDEASNVVACLESALANREVAAIRVLDDGSRDRTAELASGVAMRDARVEVVAVPAPPPGWSGKTHALSHGARAARTPWLLSLDADARPAPDAIGRALAAAAAERLDAVSLAASQRVGSIGEALLTPIVFGLLDLRLGDWRPLARGEGPTVANGQFLMVRRDALETIGGFESIAREMLDDVALATRLAGRGFRVGFWRANGALAVRMYRGFGASFRGWRRNLALLVGDRRAFVARFVVAAVAPAAVAAAAFASGRVAAGALAWSGGALASALLRAGTGSPWLGGLLYPLDALVTGACLATATRDRARGVLAPWRGRAVSSPHSSASSGEA